MICCRNGRVNLTRSLATLLTTRTGETVLGSRAALRVPCWVYIALSDLFNSGTTVMNRHVVFEELSQRYFRRTATGKNDIPHSRANCARITAPDSYHEVFTLIDHEMPSYIPKSAFVPAQCSTAQFPGMKSDVLSSMLAKPIHVCSCQTFKHTVDKMHRQVCGHSPYSSIKLLLIREKF